MGPMFVGSVSAKLSTLNSLSLAMFRKFSLRPRSAGESENTQTFVELLRITLNFEPRNCISSPTLAKFLDFYRGEKEISDIDRVLCHEGAMVRYTIEHNALGVIQQSVHIGVLGGVQ